MQITGQITNIQPKGGYQGQKGYIYTFDMAIQSPQGQHIGEIGSKSQIYPMQLGETIIVDVTKTEHGVRFKKVNPKYAGSPQNAQQPTGKPNDNQLHIRRGNALNAIMSATEIPSDKIGDFLNAGLRWIETGQWSLLPPRVQTPPAENPPPSEDDYIPAIDDPQY